MLTDLNLEERENEHFGIIRFHLKQDFPRIMEGLNSRLRILKDWHQKFLNTARKGYKASDLETGAERIFHNLFAPSLKFPNSSPIGSDLMFEVPDAFLHIEIKTALIDNPSDYKGKINIAINQTSYSVNKVFSPNLPYYYHPDKDEKPCLTYAIQIIHEHAKPNIKALKLLCIPNGQLFPHYERSIFRSGKGGKEKARDFRYNYAAEPFFKLLKQKHQQNIFRVELIYLAKDLKPEEITNLSKVPVHFLS